MIDWELFLKAALTIVFVVTIAMLPPIVISLIYGRVGCVFVVVTVPIACEVFKMLLSNWLF